jgi:hypothetical protein
MSKKTNDKRSLDQIAEAIYAAESENLFARGDLLSEAKTTYPGEFLAWLGDNFEWSHDTAERFMKVAKLGKDYAILRNLKLGRMTLYELCEFEGDELTAVVSELAKHAKQKRIKPQEADRYIEIAQARIVHGDRPDATLYALAQYSGAPQFQDIEATLKAKNPTTDAAAGLIIEKFEDKRAEEEEARRAEQEAKQEAKYEREQAEREQAEREPKPVKPITPAEAMPGSIGPMISPSPEDELLDKANKAFALGTYEGAGIISDELADAVDQVITRWTRLRSELRTRQDDTESRERTAA